MNPQTWWFVARSTGMVAYVLLSIAVIGGLLLSTSLLGRRPPPNWMLDWHRFVSGLVVIFTGLHLVSLLVDDYIEFRIVDLLVPFVSGWRPLAVAWGVFALYLALAVEVTSLVRQRMPLVWWRRIHYLSLPLFVLVTAHLLMAGADADHPLVLVAVGGLSATVLLLLALRLPPVFTAERARDE